MDIMTMPKFDNWTTITIKPVNILMIFGYKLKIIYMFVDHYHWIITIMIWQWHCDVPNLAVGYLTHIWNVRTPAATMVCVDFYTHMPVCKHFLYIYIHTHIDMFVSIEHFSGFVKFDLNDSMNYSWSKRPGPPFDLFSFVHIFPVFFLCISCMLNSDAF